MLKPQLSHRIVLSIIIAAALTACQSDKEQTLDATNKTHLEKNGVSQQKVEPLRSVEAALASKPIVQTAFLRDNLPDSAFAYARIPNIWSFIGTPKGNVYDTAINAKPLFDTVQAIRLGLIENVIPEIPDEEARQLTKLVVKHFNSPLEVIAIEGVDAAVPSPNLVLNVGADFSSVDEIKKLLAALATKLPELEISKSMQTDGYAELKVANMSAQLKWDQSSSRLTLLLGLSLSPNNLVDFMQTLAPNPNHQMKALENTIDSSGQGVFAWANPRKLSSMGSAMGMQKQLAPLAVMGVSSMKNIALGAGTSGGINRFKYVTEMPVTGFRSYLPIINTAPTFNVIGKTKMVAVLGLPSRADFASIENTVALVTPPKDMEAYYKFKKGFEQALGFAVEDIFDFFGQDISFVSDEAGGYVAVRLNDAEKFKTTLDNSVKNLNLEYQQREIGRHTYHHLKLPSVYQHYVDEAEKQGKPIKDNRLLKRLMSMPSHVYWEQEGDYLIFANIPQTLIDRHYIPTQSTAKDWLEKQQRLEATGALFMASVNNDGLAKKMYRMHLGALNSMADFTGKPVDMFALATPREANLPDKSSFGFKVTSSETQLAFELNYESNPFEILFAGGGYQSLVALAILPAIAAPAYQDYRVRAELATAFVEAQVIKLKLNEFEIEYGRYPNEFEIEDLKLNRTNKDYSISVSANNGEIKIRYKNRALRSRNTLTLIPPKQGVSTTWRCEAKIRNKYLPAACRKSYK